MPADSKGDRLVLDKRAIVRDKSHMRMNTKGHPKSSVSVERRIRYMLDAMVERRCINLPALAKEFKLRWVNLKHNIACNRGRLRDKFEEAGDRVKFALMDDMIQVANGYRKGDCTALRKAIEFIDQSPWLPKPKAELKKLQQVLTEEELKRFGLAPSSYDDSEEDEEIDYDALDDGDYEPGPNDDTGPDMEEIEE